jgi:hypothetical protein
LLESGEREADVGGNVAVHAEKLAHVDRRGCVVGVPQ